MPVFMYNKTKHTQPPEVCLVESVSTGGSMGREGVTKHPQGGG